MTVDDFLYILALFMRWICKWSMIVGWICMIGFWDRDWACLISLAAALWWVMNWSVEGMREIVYEDEQ